MEELVRQFLAEMRATWQYRRLGLLAAWLCAALLFGAVMTVPDRYEASARVFVNTDSILKPLMAGMTVEPNTDQRIAVLSRVVISRPNVEKLLSLVGLEKEAKTSEEYEQIADQLAKDLRISGTGRDNVYTLSYRDRDPARGKRMVELFTSLFVELGRGTKTNDTDVAKRFIDEQLVAYEKKLQEAENRLKDFRLRYLGMNPGTGRDYFVSMQEASAQLTQAQLQLREAENSRDALRQELQRELASEERRTVQETAPSPPAREAMVEVDARIDAMRRNLDVLLQKYTDSHPDVVGARRVLRDLEEERRQLALVARQEPPQPAISRTVVRGPNAYEQLKVSIAQAEASIASLRTRVAEYEARYSRLKESARLVPQLEAEYAQLNRDYDINKKNYESLITRRDSAELSSEMQSVAGVGDFRLIDPPHVSARPVRPNRTLLMPLALLAALAAGVAAAYAAAKVRPTFQDARSLRAATGLPVLGAVSLRMTKAIAAKRRRSIFGFFAGLVTLLASYAAGFAALMLMSARAV